MTALAACVALAASAAAMPRPDEEKSEKGNQPQGGIASPATCGNQKLVDSSAGPADLIGFNAALRGDTLLVGAPWDDNASGPHSGKVVAWENFNGGWQQIPAPIPNVPQAGAFFGRSIGLGGEYAVVGAPFESNYKGTAYFFKRLPGAPGVGWTQLPTQRPPDIVTDDYFATSAAINETGDIAVFGAPQKDITDASGTDDDAGKVYIYARNPDGTWSLEASLWDTDPATREPVSYLGAHVAISGEVAVISVRSDDAFGLFDCGSVRVYRRDAQHQWNLETVLFAPLPQANAYFGESVAIDGDEIVVGSMLESNTWMNDGAVHAYRYQSGTWVNDGLILAPIPVAQEAFGGSVAISGDRVVASCDEWFQPDNFVKRAFVFKRMAAGIWFVEKILFDPDDNANGFFGTAVAMDGARFAVTDSIDDPTVNGGVVNDAGAAYVYTIASDECAYAAEITAGSYFGCTEGLGIEMANMCGYPAPSGPDVWFSFTAACEGTLTIDTNGSNFDTVVSVHNECIEDGGITIACDDDSGIGTASQLTLATDPGYRYLIRVAGWDGQSGQFALHLSTACPAPEICPADIAPQPSGDGVVNSADLLMIINNWGINLGPADIAPQPNGDGMVNAADLLMVINSWGACP
ncbi:MAG TPA: dockerin type I domain-containing protein [Burkholderiales bacterium]|nr:dockerin type I domain-containing protein [Burkholderiales bacterium]